MDERELKAALEAIIFASGEPVPAGRISLVLGVPEAEVYSCAEALAEEYEREGRGSRLVRLDKSMHRSMPRPLPGSLSTALRQSSRRPRWRRWPLSPTSSP